MTAKFVLSKNEIQDNVAKLNKLIGEHSLDAFYVSSFDQYINEYVPRQECWRYYLSGFTGSMAEVIVSAGKVHLFVDGRYHEQADKEVDTSYCVVHKCAFYPDILPAMDELIRQNNIKKIGLLQKRTPVQLRPTLFKGLEVKGFDDDQMRASIPFKSYKFDTVAFLLDKELGLESFLQKSERILGENEAFYISAMDSVSWISNIRAYQFPYQSSIAAKAIFTKKELFLFVPEPKLVSDEIKSLYKVLDDSNESLLKVFKELKNIKCVLFDDAKTSFNDEKLLLEVFGNKLTNTPLGLVKYHSFKTDIELNEFRKSFDKGDSAIYETLKTIKEKAKKGEYLSEIEMASMLEDNYKKNGANSQSFKTISGLGANGSIIHYSTPSDKLAHPEDLYLLDSGGYFESGFATDTTRTISIGGSASPKQKEIYTLVLKGLLQTQNAIFPDGTWGSQLDSLARFQMRQYGYDYAHGTGHGVGINVHEGNFRISPTSSIPLRAGQVGSIEPGIYIEGFGGVRLENIAIVKKHPTLKGMLCFENLVYIGFDHSLIDFSLLTSQEVLWLNEYEKECEKRGRSFLN